MGLRSVFQGLGDSKTIGRSRIVFEVVTMVTWVDSSYLIFT